MAWRTMLLRGTPVLARCDEEGELVAEKAGRVEIRYKPGASKSYAATASNLEADPEDARIFEDTFCTDAALKKGKKKSAKKSTGTPPTMPEEGELLAYCDGACSGNPGPAGLGVVIRFEGEERMLSEYLGQGTNNIAELTAIMRVAEAVEDADTTVHLYTDSTYAIGLLTKGWKAKKNKELVAEVREACARLSDLNFHHVKGHAGHELNEAADALAVAAVDARSSSEWASRALPAKTT